MGCWAVVPRGRGGVEGGGCRGGVACSDRQWLCSRWGPAALRYIKETGGLLSQGRRGVGGGLQQQGVVGVALWGPAVLPCMKETVGLPRQSCAASVCVCSPETPLRV